MITDLISRKKLLEAINMLPDYFNSVDTDFYDAVIETINNLNAEHSNEVIKAYWIEKEESDECSYCGFEVPISFPACRRCPNCGAYMCEEIING